MEIVMPEMILPILGVLGALAGATVVAYLLLNSAYLHTHHKH
jgi:hypothetical protein